MKTWEVGQWSDGKTWAKYGEKRIGAKNLLWSVAYESGEEVVGDSGDVEALADWQGASTWRRSQRQHQPLLPSRWRRVLAWLGCRS